MYKYIGDTGLLTYDFLNFFSIVLVWGYNYFNFNKKKKFLSNRAQYYIRRNLLKKNGLFSKTGFWTFIEIFVISGAQHLFFGVLLNTLLGEFLYTGPNYYGILLGTPYILFALFYYLSINPLKQMDLITPAFPLSLISIKMACFCMGCCRGFECSWGLYFPSVDITCFPTQLLEITQAIILFIILLKYKNKAKEGTMFPFFLTIYSATRFFIEFTSGRDKLFFELFNIYHVLCFIGVIVGLMYWKIVCKWSDEIIYLYDRGFVYENGRCRRVKIKRKVSINKLKLKK